MHKWGKLKMKNRKQSLSEAFGYSKRPRKISINELRRLIESELVLEEKEEKKDKKEKEGEVDESVPEQFRNPKMTSTSADGTGNIKDVPADEIVAQMLSGDPEAPVVAAIGAFHNTKFTPDFSNNVATKEGAEELKKWVLSKGAAYIANNIATVQGKIPASGLDKSKMPALEPDDVSAVEDALTPGGSFNIDMADPMADGESSVEKWFEDQKGQSGEGDDTKKEAISRVALRLFEEKFPQNHPQGMPGGSSTDPKDLALAFLTKGLKDGAADDDSIQVKQDDPVNVADMIPTQSNIQLGKSLSFALGGGFGGKDLGAYITGGNEILDGHHRWSGTMIVDPGASITGHKIYAPASDILPALTALGNAFGNAQKGQKKEESVRKSDQVIIERWQKLAGILNG
jgi:hypothetical protein